MTDVIISRKLVKSVNNEKLTKLYNNCNVKKNLLVQEQVIMKDNPMWKQLQKIYKTANKGVTRSMINSRKLARQKKKQEQQDCNHNNINQSSTGRDEKNIKDESWNQRQITNTTHMINKCVLMQEIINKNNPDINEYTEVICMEKLNNAQKCIKWPYLKKICI